MSDQTLGSTTGVGVTSTAPDGALLTAGRRDASIDGKKQDEKPLEERKVYEAGGVIVCGGKVVLRLTDRQHWIFPKGKLKKRERARDAAIREATEETGLKVEVIDQVADLLIRHEGKKRRFIFFLMRAAASSWDWRHHEGRDTFLISPERIGGLIRHKGFASVWEASADRVRAIVDDSTPLVAHQTGRPTAASGD